MTVQQSSPARTNSAAFLKKHSLKLMAALFWIALVGTSTWYYRSHGLTTTTATAQIVQLLDSRWGPILKSSPKKESL